MRRDLRRLADTSFDVLVIGGGIYGAATAWDAAQRGLSVALVDRGDFGSGTSFNNLKTLHGGLRSLAALDLRQMALFIRERRALARIVPHLVRPLGFVVPTTWHPLRNRPAWRALLALNDFFARHRDEGAVDPSLHLPPGRVVDRDEALRLNPVIAAEGVSGGAVWHDYQMTNSDRVTLSFVLSAADAGACASNYVDVTSLLREGGTVIGGRCRDVLGGGTFDIRASVVVNAAGGWAWSLLDGAPEALRAAPPRRLSRAMNLVLPPVVQAHACGGVVDGRYLFLVPWRNAMIAGTSHDVLDGGPDALHVTRWDLEAFVKDVRTAFPHAGITSADVRLIHRGLLPMVSGHGVHVKLLRESLVVDHRQQGVNGLVSIFGVRYTTARHTARETIDTVFRLRGSAVPPPCRTEDTPLSGGSITNVEQFLKAASLRDLEGLPPATVRRIASDYGTLYDAVLQIARDVPALSEPIGEHCPVLGAEILHACRQEMAMTLGDAVIRRTGAGAAGHPGADALQRAAAIMARFHGWDERRREEEVEKAAQFYQQVDG